MYLYIYVLKTVVLYCGHFEKCLKYDMICEFIVLKSSFATRWQTMPAGLN